MHDELEQQHSRTENMAKMIGLKAQSLLPAFLCLSASLILSESQNVLDFRSTFLSAELKNKRDLINRPDAYLWAEAEHTEIQTTWNMGTFEICD